MTGSSVRTFGESSPASFCHPEQSDNTAEVANGRWELATGGANSCVGCAAPPRWSRARSGELRSRVQKTFASRMGAWWNLASETSLARLASLCWCARRDERQSRCPIVPPITSSEKQTPLGTAFMFSFLLLLWLLRFYLNADLFTVACRLSFALGLQLAHSRSGVCVVLLLLGSRGESNS